MNGTRPVGAASTIVFFDALGPSLNITAPLNGSQTVAASVLVEGFASSASGIERVSLFNAATGITTLTNTTTPQWSALIALATSAPNAITATAVDTLGQTTSATVVVIQEGLNPQLTCPRDFSIQCGTVVPTPALRVLNCLESVQLSESSMPTCGNSAKSITRVFSACGASCTYKVLLVDITPPAITCPGNVSIACGGVLPQAVALDLCSGTNVTIQVEPTQAVCGTNFSRSFTATDGCGNSASCFHFVSVAFPTTTQNTSVQTTSAALSDGAIGGLVAGIVLLLLILVLAFLIALCWLRKKKRESSAISSAPIMMADFDDDLSSTSVSSVTSSKLYRQPPNQSDDSADFQELMRNH